MPARKDEVKYRVNKRGEVVHAEVQPLPPAEQITPPVGPSPREAVRQNTVQALAVVSRTQRAEANRKRLDDRRIVRDQERSDALALAAIRAGDPDDHVTQERLRLGDIIVPEEYQRLLNTERALGYALRFSWESFQSISVNRRPDGSLVLSDGQHRLYAAQLVFGDDVMVKCNVTTIENVPQEAIHFLTMNTERVGLNYNSAFKARLTGHDANAERVVALLQEFGLDYTRPGENRGQPGKVTATATLESMIRQAGMSSGRVVLSILKEVWGDRPEAYRDYLLGGLWQFVIRYDGLYKRERIITAFKRDGLDEISERVNDFKTSVNSSSAAAACGSIHFSYNWHLQVRDALPPFSSEAKNRYAALIRKCARDWVVRHEGKNGQAMLAARSVSGLYAPGSQVPNANLGHRKQQIAAPAETPSHLPDATIE